MDRLTVLDIKSQLAFVVLVVIVLIFVVICSAWLLPFIPYAGVSWYGVPWVNFRHLLCVIGICAPPFVITRAYRNKWIREAKVEKARRNGPVAAVAPAKKRESTIDEVIKRAAREAAEEVTEEKKEGGEK